MRRRLALRTTAAALIALAAPATATAASNPTLTAQRCAFSHPAQRIAFLGKGFRPGQLYSLSLGGHRVQQGVIAGDGTALARFRAPSIGHHPEEVARTLILGAGDATARRVIHLVNFGVTISPSPRGHSPRDRFRFRLFGFLPGGRLYLHYVRPDGHLERTFALGRPHGACGNLATPRRVLFPFRARPGTWRLQFDKHRAYSPRAKAPRLRLKLPIRVRRG